MHAKGIVKLMLTTCLSSLHDKQAEALRAGVCAALEGGHLSLSQLARKLHSRVALRYRVKRMDRLLGNDAIHAKRGEVYGSLARHWLNDLGPLLIVVDWSPLTRDQQWHLLRASVAVEGRSVTLYEEVHPRHRLGSRWVHQRFLGQMAKLLPDGCMPIVMTDAGFRSSWFDSLERRRWQWIGRIRNQDMVSIDGAPWQAVKKLYEMATEQAQEFANVLHVRNRPTRRRLILIKKTPKGRVRQTRFGRRCHSKLSLQIAKRESEPWLLACSAGLAHLSPSAVVTLYAQRMRIEQSFRDTKNPQLGMGLSDARSRSARRLEMLLMIGHLASWLLRLIGESAQQKQLVFRFQSTCRSDRKEISVMTLASRVMQAGLQWLSPSILHQALERLRNQARMACCGN
jgi:hypothetical protein